MAEAKRTDPELWEQVKDEITRSDKGGEPGQWSARKAQMAVQEYKKRGGGYEDDGPDQEETDLHQWTAEEWGTKSGGQSGETGERYLPKKVRMLLTEEEYARSTARKEMGETQHVAQPDDVREKVSRIKADGPTKDDLLTRARDLGIDGRSTMGKDELMDAIDAATDGNGRGWGSIASLREMTKDELVEMARQRDLDGRSTMDKEELVTALAGGGGAAGGSGRGSGGAAGGGSDDRRGAPRAGGDGAHNGGDRAEGSFLHAHNVDELQDMARARDIDGRSSMNKDQLIAALEARDKGRDELAGMTKDELAEIARLRDVSGRSGMTKDQLVDALA